MENKSRSRVEYDKLSKLVNILNDKFKDATGVDYFDAKDNSTRYDRVLENYNIDGVAKENITSDDVEKMKEVVEVLKGKVQEAEEAKKSLKEKYEKELEKLSEDEKTAIKEYNELSSKDRKELTAEETKKMRDIYLKNQDIIDSDRENKKENRDIDKNIRKFAKVKNQLELKAEAKEAIEGYDKEQLKDIDKYYNILINHPEYKKDILELKETQEKVLNDMQEELKDGSYAKRYEEDKNAKTFDDLSEGIKGKVEEEKDTFFSKEGDVLDEDKFKQKLDDIAKEEQNERITKKEEQLDKIDFQIGKYGDVKSTEKLKEEVEQELREMNATFNENDLVLKKYYDKIVKFEEEISTIEKQTRKINDEIINLELENDRNGYIKTNVLEELNEKNEILAKLDADRNSTLEEIIKVKEEMYKEQAFLDRVIDERDLLKKKLETEKAKEKEEEKEILEEVGGLVNELSQMLVEEGQSIVIADGYDKLFKYLGNPITIDPKNIEAEVGKIQNEAIKKFEENRNSNKIQEKIDNLNNFIGDRQKTQTNEEKDKEEAKVKDFGDIENETTEEKKDQENDNKQNADKAEQSASKPYTEQINANGPTRINTKSQRPKDIANDEIKVAKEGRFSKFKKKITDKFNSIKEKVKNKYDNFLNGKNKEKDQEEEKIAKSNDNQETVIIDTEKETKDIPEIKEKNDNKEQTQNTREENSENKENTSGEKINNEKKENKEKNIFEKVKAEVDDIRKEIEENISTQKDIDLFISKNIEDIESGKYTKPKEEETKETKETKEQENDQREI